MLLQFPLGGQQLLARRLPLPLRTGVHRTSFGLILVLAAHESLEPIERVRDAAGMLGPQLVSWEAALDHLQQRPVGALFEGELCLEPQCRAVQPHLGCREQEASRAVDHLEHVAVPVELLGRSAKRDRPGAADADLALGPHDPSWVVLSVERDLAAGTREGIEDHFRRRPDDALVAQLVGHRGCSSA